MVLQIGVVEVVARLTQGIQLSQQNHLELADLVL
jgi:hypothetical protein